MRRNCKRQKLPGTLASDLSIEDAQGVVAADQPHVMQGRQVAFQASAASELIIEVARGGTGFDQVA
ncbi:hypothetical protein A8O37_25785 [Pseudomonas aeruginosa]|nr:hypothetical protein A8O37_25785 [Pseudomonas aeruginosa]